MKVLVVDDNEILASTIQLILEREGIEVMSAGDGKEGYSVFLDFQPDLIITDIQMPEQNGLEMMGNIRIHNPMIKTVYMSANMESFQPFLEEEKKKYPVRCVEKPFSLEALMESVSVSDQPVH